MVSPLIPYSKFCLAHSKKTKYFFEPYKPKRKQTNFKIGANIYQENFGRPLILHSYTTHAYKNHRNYPNSLVYSYSQNLKFPWSSLTYSLQFSLFEL